MNNVSKIVPLKFKPVISSIYRYSSSSPLSPILYKLQYLDNTTLVSHAPTFQILILNLQNFLSASLTWINIEMNRFKTKLLVLYYSLPLSHISLCCLRNNPIFLSHLVKYTGFLDLNFICKDTNLSKFKYPICM